MILFAYCFSFLFEQLKTANNWFGTVNVIFGFMVLPTILLGKGTPFEHLEWIKNFYPFYDLGFEYLGRSFGANSLLPEFESTIHRSILSLIHI